MSLVYSYIIFIMYIYVKVATVRAYARNGKSPLINNSDKKKNANRKKTRVWKVECEWAERRGPCAGWLKGTLYESVIIRSFVCKIPCIQYIYNIYTSLGESPDRRIRPRAAAYYFQSVFYTCIMRPNRWVNRIRFIYTATLKKKKYK